jgi:leukotriene-A4 hydrolase
VLDTRDLTIRAVRLEDGTPLAHRLAPAQPFLGQALTIDAPAGTPRVVIEYETSPQAAALQWLAPAQTAGGKQPFLFTQSQAILARTWLPLQDTPTVRFTYDATVRVPKGLLALMSAENPTTRSADGVYRFRMTQAIPSYLMALAVGDLDFRGLGQRSGVYAEPSVLDKAAAEFADTEEMIDAAQYLYGIYRWGRYDLLVLPPSFPFGGMENPRLTFATPTIIAGDRSLVSLVAHELAHSWSGNLVTNATWNDFWLNEGFTVYVERRILEEVYGRDFAEMESVLSLAELREEIATMGATSRDTHLFLDLAGRDPDDGMNGVAYDKGYFFLRTLEVATGRAKWDAFLRGYFDTFGFRSVTSQNFLAFLKRQLPETVAKVDIDAWVFAPGLPATFDKPVSARFAKVEAELARFVAGAPAGALEASAWSTQERLHFLRQLPSPLAAGRMAELDKAWKLTETGNSELASQWLQLAIANRYGTADGALERFLTTVGRRKFLKPIYTELAKSAEGRAKANKIYTKARPGYHSVSANTVDEILGWKDGKPAG